MEKNLKNAHRYTHTHISEPLYCVLGTNTIL